MKAPNKRSRVKKPPGAVNQVQLKITLKRISPPIWRRVVVADNCSLGDLHEVIQIAMGWTDSHLHLFRIGLLEYGVPDEDDLPESPVLDDCSVLLRHVIGPNTKRFEYEYDFGDGWTHEIRVEKMDPIEARRLPICSGGARACPPEDCGGPFGYERVLRVLKTATTPDDREFRDWVGEFDPDCFDVVQVNRRLAARCG